MEQKFVIGVDFGTDSVRSVIVNAFNGDEVASSVFHYPRWKKGLYCNPAQNQFRQHPLDYIEGLENTIRDCVNKAGKEVAANIVAISVDTTGSTPVLLTKAELLWLCFRNLKTIQMQCLFCGRTIRLRQKLQRSMSRQRNLTSIICSMSEVFILQNGFGQNYFVYCA